MLIPVQRKFTKPQSTPFARSSKKAVFSVKNPRISLRVIWIVFGSLLGIYGIFLAIKFTLFVPEYTVTKIEYAKASHQIYDDPYFYKLVTTLLKGENYRVLQWNHGRILSQIQEKYPFVSDYDLIYQRANTVFFKAYFTSPELTVFNGNMRYAVYEDGFFQLSSGNTLGSGSLRVELAPYITGMSLTGLFYQKPFTGFVEDLRTVTTAFPSAMYYVYLVGGQRLIVGFPNYREVYINLLGDIPGQLQNYQYLRQYYTDFAKLKVVDLGSIEMDKVIVRK